MPRRGLNYESLTLRENKEANPLPISSRTSIKWWPAAYRTDDYRQRWLVRAQMLGALYGADGCVIIFYYHVISQLLYNISGPGLIANLVWLDVQGGP